MDVICHQYFIVLLEKDLYFWKYKADRATMNKTFSALICCAALFLFFSCTKEKETAVTSVTINKASIELTVGESSQLSATVLPSDAKDKTVSWTSSNQSVASVNSSGLVNALTEGTATITASAGGKSGSCQVTVSKGVVVISSIELDQSEISLVEGESIVLNVIVKPDNATDKTVTWSSSETSVATVDESGKVTAIAKGQATITAQAQNHKAICVVTVISGSLSVLYKTSTGSLAELYSSEGIKENRKSTEEGWNELVLKPGSTTIKEWFKENESIVNVIIPEGIDSISHHAFYLCKGLESVQLPESLLDIGDFSFLTCTNLPDISLPSSLRSIGYGSFKNCLSLTSFTIPESVKTIGEEFLSICYNLESIDGKRYYVRDGVLLAFAPSGVTSAILPEGIVRIGDNVFGACEQLTEIVLPSGLTSIGNNAFWYSGIKSIQIPDSVTDMGIYAFYRCANLEQVSLSKNLKSIGMFTFEGCNMLKSITIPDSVTSIDNGAFSWCENLVSVKLGAGVSSLGGFIVSDCPKLTNLTIHATTPPQVVENTFQEDINYTIFVPSNSLNAYKEASGWSRLSPYMYAAPEEGNIAFQDAFVKNDCVAVLDKDGDGELSYLEAATASLEDISWLKRQQYSTFNEFQYFLSIKEIPRSFFFNCPDLKEITLPKSIKVIGVNAFYYCVSLSSIDIPDGTKTIGDLAFSDCHNLSTISIPDSVTEIGGNLFANCPNLESINGGRILVRNNILYAFAPKGITNFTIPTGITSVGVYAFSASELEEIIIPDSVIEIGDGAFAACNNLQQVSLPKGLTAISASLFRACPKLTSIEIPEGVTSIGTDAFSDCHSLETVSIPAGITSIGSYAFNYCLNLSSIILPEGITTIENGVFTACESLKSISIPNSVTTIVKTAFNRCSGLVSVTIPEGVTEIGLMAFQDCSSLESIKVLPKTPPTGGTNMFKNTNNCPIYVSAESIEEYKEASYWKEYADRITAIPNND